MEENHYSPGLRSPYHASTAKAGERDRNICRVVLVVVEEGCAYVFMHVR